VTREPEVGEEPGMHGRVQGLDAAVEGLGESGQCAHLGDRVAGVGDDLGRRTRRHDLDALLGERRRQLEQSGLVGDRDERPPDGDQVAFAVVCVCRICVCRVCV
jgi:hypothetical protein